MIHAAITAAALSCAAITTDARNLEPVHASLVPGDARTVTIDFVGGSVADYVSTVGEAFAAGGRAPNIVLFPGTEGVSLPPITLGVDRAEDALSVIADHVYRSENGVQISIELETLGSNESIHRLSGQEMRPRSSGSRASTPRGVRIEGDGGVDLTIVPVDGQRMDAVVRIASRALQLAKVPGSKLTPIPEQDLLLVLSTEQGRDIVEQIADHVATMPPKRRSRSGDDPVDEKIEGESKAPASPTSRDLDASDDPREVMSRAARIRNDAAADPAAKAEARRDFDRARRALRDRTRSSD